MSRIFVIGDIHGAYRALRQCLMKSRFDYETDRLICLGDVADGWPDTRAAIDELLKIKRLTYLLGNHDWWTREWMRSGKIADLWYRQGGKATIESYSEGLPVSHLDFLSQARLYYIEHDRLFVHAGIDPLTPLEHQDESTFLWDRSLAALALEAYPMDAGEKLSAFEDIYIGHTPIPYPHPIRSLGVWLMDTGAGWSGSLSMMNIQTNEMFISDPVPELYPNVEGRKRWKQS